MGLYRNGARTFLNVLAKACRLSHMTGFRKGLETILGGDVVVDFYVVWTPLCAFVDTLVAADDWYNQVDYNREVADTEDRVPA
jgi:hypothetical protein